MANKTSNYNLKVINPQLAQEWHPSKNGNLTPNDVTVNSGQKVWWICHKGHEWQTTIDNRSRGKNCPYCSGKKVCNDNCLETVNPELSKEWHPTKNGKLSPKDFTSGSEQKVWWKCKKGHEWPAIINNRNRGRGCPYCSGQKVCIDNCLKTVNPQLAKEWHPTKNGNLTPRDITVNSGRKVRWICKKNHEWEAIIAHRNKGSDCPYCSGHRVCIDNCLETINPKLAKEWHPTKNGNLSSRDITENSNQKVWWVCKKYHEWQETVSNRTNGENCPYCSEHRVCIDNCLETINPQLAKEWHPFKNGCLTPRDITAGSERKIWWLCKKGHEWPAKVYSRNSGGNCPFCNPSSSQFEIRLFTELKYLFPNAIHRTKLFGQEIDIYLPSLRIGIEVDGIYWHKDKYNNDLQRNYELTQNGITMIRLREKGLELLSNNDITYIGSNINFSLLKKIVSRIVNLVKRNKTVLEKLNNYLTRHTFINDDEYLNLIRFLPSPLPGTSLYDLNKSLSNEWHPTKNNGLTAKDVTLFTHLKVWWICSKGHEWPSTVANRSRGDGCPYCSGRRVNNENCLDKINPQLAKEWHPTRNGNLTTMDIVPGSNKQVWWMCSKGHEWPVSVNSRNQGSKCPYCTGQKVCNDNCLEVLKPVLAQEWHPIKNGKMTPRDVTVSSGKNIWWVCEKGHEWPATVDNRNHGSKCPYCTGLKASSDNCLEVVKPLLAKEWHPTKNGNITPRDVTVSSGKRVWWKCENGHEWPAIIANRSRGSKCPQCYKSQRYKK